MKRNEVRSRLDALISAQCSLCGGQDVVVDDSAGRRMGEALRRESMRPERKRAAAEGNLRRAAGIRSGEIVPDPIPEWLLPFLDEDDEPSRIERESRCALCGRVDRESESERVGRGVGRILAQARRRDGDPKLLEQEAAELFAEADLLEGMSPEELEAHIVAPFRSEDRRSATEVTVQRKLK